MNFPLISVIVPVFNTHRYLKPCLDSLCRQTYPNLEVWCVDDGSSDGSRQLCEEYATRYANLHVTVTQNGKGVSAARNTGLRLAKGAYIAFVDSDDFMAEDMYSYLYGLLEQTGAELSVCGVLRNTMTNPNHWQEETLFSAPYQQIPAQQFLQWATWPHVWNKLFKRELLKNVCFREELSHGEDTVFMFEVLIKDPCVVGGTLCKYYYRENAGSLSHRFRQSHLNVFNFMDSMLSYAQQHKLERLYKNIYMGRILLARSWLFQLCKEPQSDPHCVEVLQNYLKQHFGYYWCHSSESLVKKMFATMVCVNFRITKFMYQTFQQVTHRK